MDTAARFSSTVLAGESGAVVASSTLKLLLKACRRLPRGRGAVARMIGRMVLRKRLLAHDMPGGYRMLWSSHVIEQFGNALDTGWDEHVLRAINSVLKPSDVFYDVGANAGYMSLSVASRGLQNQIYAFEPLPELAAALAASARSNEFDNLTVVKGALADRDEGMEFFLPSHSIHASFVSREKSAIRLWVEGFRLDTLIERGLIPPPNVIKIDVEGAEMQIFRGAEKTLAQYKPALIFECDENSLRFGHSPGKVLTFLNNIGYKNFSILEKDRTSDIAVDKLPRAPFGDFMALAA